MQQVVSKSLQWDKLQGQLYMLVRTKKLRLMAPTAEQIPFSQTETTAAGTCNSTRNEMQDGIAITKESAHNATSSTNNESVELREYMGF